MLYESIALPAELRWRRRKVAPPTLETAGVSEEGEVKQTAPNGVKAMRAVLFSAADVAEIIDVLGFPTSVSGSINH